MNEYITLNGKKYVTLAKTWIPTFQKPMTVRNTLLGEVSATYGPAVIKGWQGEIKAPASVSDASWGTVDDLLSALDTLGPVSFTDHMGVTVDVHVTMTANRRALVNVWDSASNCFYVPVAMTRAS